MLLRIHVTRCEAKLISAKFLMLGDDFLVCNFLSSITFPWLLMIFQSSMTFHDFSWKFYVSRFSRFSRPCGNPVACSNISGSCMHQRYLNSLWPGDAIWRHKTGSTLAQVMACCLMAPSPQCWLIISKVQCHSSQCNVTRDTSATKH